MARSVPPRPRQQTPEELQRGLLDFVRGKFYGPEEGIDFAKDRPRLLKWVILWPARWLDDRGLSFPAGKYRQIVQQALLDALVHQRGTLSYRPAWLAKVIQSHFAHHEDEYHNAAKAIENRLALALDRLPRSSPDHELAAVTQLARAHRMIRPPRRSKRPTDNGQLNLL